MAMSKQAIRPLGLEAYVIKTTASIIRSFTTDSAYNFFDFFHSWN